jgi:hypothetical protein
MMRAAGQREATMKGAAMSIGFDISGFQTMFYIVFALVAGVAAFAIIRGVAAWAKNNSSPRIAATARIVAKRAAVSGGGGDTAPSTSYYATFQFDTGDRLELHVPHREYGLLAENDSGTLTFQGTRYLSFERR